MDEEDLPDVADLQDADLDESEEVSLAAWQPDSNTAIASYFLPTNQKIRYSAVSCFVAISCCCSRRKKFDLH